MKLIKRLHKTSPVEDLSVRAIRAMALHDEPDKACEAFLREMLETLDAEFVRLYSLDAGQNMTELCFSGIVRHSWAGDEDSVIREAIAAKALTQQGRVIALPLKSENLTVGVIEIGFSLRVQPENWRLAALHEMNDVAVVAIRALMAERTRKSIQTKKERLSVATSDILKGMAIVPAQQLLATVQRRFEFWLQTPSVPGLGFLTSTLQTLVDHLRVVVGAEMTALGIGRFPDEPFEPWVVSGVPDDLKRRLGRNPRPVGVLGVTAIHGTKLRTNDVTHDPNFKGVPSGHPRVKSFVSVPIRFGGVSLGTLYAANKLEGEAFTDEDEFATEELAKLAAAVMQEAYFYSSFEVRHAQIQSLLDSAPSGIFFMDAKTGRIVANAATVELFGSPLIESFGRDQYVRHVLTPDGKPLALEDLPSSEALLGKTVLGRELLLRRANGQILPIRVNSAPVFGFQNQIIGAVVVLENIASVKELEQFRQDLAAMLAHDLRNPVQAILMTAELLERQSGFDTGAKKHIQSIRQNIGRLNRMISELVEVARIQERQVTLTLETLNLCQFVRNLLDRLRPAYPKRTIELECGDSALVKVDPYRMDQVLTNLVDNAAKYSPPETAISISVGVKEQAVEIAVRDRGKGMTAEQLKHIFERYYRAKREQGAGLGLGLYIVKGLVDAHSGTITVESEPGKGTTFRIRMALATESAGAVKTDTGRSASQP